MSANNIVVSKLKEIPTSKQPVEIVERKGIGHPDSVCDGIVEQYSHYLTKHYYEHFSTPLHHNVDKAVLVGGKSTPKFGGGTIDAPILLHIVGRATNKVKTNGREKKIPVRKIGKKATKDYFNDVFRFLNPEKHVKVKLFVRPGSRDLQSLFGRTQEALPANDTSVGVGFYPLTPTEKVCLQTEKLLNSSSFKEKYPAVGEDVKVLTVRRNKKVNLTVAAAMISQLIEDIDEYRELKQEVKEAIRKNATDILDDHELRQGTIDLNSADDLQRGQVYLTVTGTSAEAGDDGEVGRGNRVNGLITPYRYLSLEAAAGKNPVSHVGKIYQVAGVELSKRIYEEVEGLHSVYTFLASKIGFSILEPQIVDVKVVTEKDITNNMQREIQEITKEYVGNLGSFWRRFLKEPPRVF
ncbi:MAG: methionine adenosyltransferase [Candidatus Korarchaeota archaeon]|nr:methionine adenosyltransferase [Candidatus Korarchaeota archaeon]NIU82821.1 methionine adenosyltransferase [Candidatus Thorarchaeota archaeon]NIW13307.1 methionine adenosyltransferase [Candidatus Thorarchaeota archaeon]NIW51413.1 methionine adenosyltransferase [Candidatus Korarchaeota archaeon]